MSQSALELINNIKLFDDIPADSVIKKPDFMSQIWLTYGSIAMKDATTSEHCLRVAEYTKAYMEKQNYPAENVMKNYFSALIHDLGKLEIPDEILKKPGALTAEEYDIMRTHSDKGLNLLPESLAQYDFLRDGIEHHHTSYNPDRERGGFPGGHISDLEGESIPETARIIAVADCFDAMFAQRPYKPPVELEKVLSNLKADPRLDQNIVERFIPFIREYMKDKENQIENQGSEISIYSADEPTRDKTLDNKISNEFQKQLNLFEAEIKGDKTSKYTPSMEDFFKVYFNNAICEMAKTIKGRDSKQEYTTMPSQFDDNGLIKAIGLYADGSDKKVGEYTLSPDDKERIIKGIARVLTQSFFAEQSKTNQIASPQNNNLNQGGSTDDIDI